MTLDDLMRRYIINKEIIESSMEKFYLSSKETSQALIDVARSLEKLKKINPKTHKRLSSRVIK